MAKTLKTEISKALRTGLYAHVRQSLQAMRTDRLLARIEAIAKLRTQRGIFLEGSSPGASDYSSGHKRKRAAEGLPVDTVDMYFSGRMLDAWRGESRFEGDALIMESGYIEGESETEAMQLARYHNVDGAGTNHVLHVFVGVTGPEGTLLLDEAEKEVLRTLGL